MSIIRTHQRAWESVPRAAAEDLRLSHASMHALFWLLTRPDNWQVRVNALMHFCSISKNVWPKVRDELIAAGYLVARRKHSVSGRIEWEFDVYSVPLQPPSPDLQVVAEQVSTNQGAIDTDYKDTLFKDTNYIEGSKFTGRASDPACVAFTLESSTLEHTRPHTPRGRKANQNQNQNPKAKPSGISITRFGDLHGENEVSA